MVLWRWRGGSSGGVVGRGSAGKGSAGRCRRDSEREKLWDLRKIIACGLRMPSDGSGIAREGRG